MILLYYSIRRKIHSHSTACVFVGGVQWYYTYNTAVANAILQHGGSGVISPRVT